MREVYGDKYRTGGVGVAHPHGTRHITSGSWDELVTTLGNIAWSLITKTTTDILNTIASWANMIAQFGAWTTTQITSVLTSWTQMVTSMGNLVWSQITKTASEVMTTIASWANILAQVGAMTFSQITTALTSWAQLTNASALGLLNFGSAIWTGTVKSANFALTSLTDSFFQGAAGLAKFITGFFTGATGRAKFANDFGLELTKLEAIPYKLPTSAYNYIVNPSYEYGTWGGSETQSNDYAKYGKYSAKVVASGSDIGTGFSNYVDIRGLSNYTISSWLKVTARTDGSFCLIIRYYSWDKVELSYEIAGYLNAIADWTQISITKTSSPTGTVFIRVDARWLYTPTGTGYVDGWQFNMGDQIPVFQDFTTYSFNWMPEKIETQSTTSFAWSSYSWTDILSMNFECESDMLLLIFAHSYAYNVAVGNTGKFRLVIDANPLPETQVNVGVTDHGWDDCYSVHSVYVASRGLHTLKLQLALTNGTGYVYARERRISILKGFYKGGIT